MRADVDREDQEHAAIVIVVSMGCHEDGSGGTRTSGWIS